MDLNLNVLVYVISKGIVFESLFYDGDNIVGRIVYQENKGKKDFINNPIYVGYRKDSKDLIFTKKHILDYLDNCISKYNTIISEAKTESLDIHTLANEKVVKLNKKIKNNSIEIENILKNQQTLFTEEREKQISCLLKNNKRCEKQIKKNFAQVTKVNKNITAMKNALHCVEIRRSNIKCL